MTMPIYSNPDLLQDIKTIIAAAKQALSSQANSVLTLAYWRIDRRVHSEALNENCADYGQHIVVAPSRQYSLASELNSQISGKIVKFWSILAINNTPHASQRCAPWGVSYFGQVVL